MKNFFEGLLIATIALIAPIKAALLTVFALLILDLVTGVAAAIKLKDPITSRKLKRSVGKFFLYEIGIIAAHIVQQYLIKDSIPALNLMTSLIGVTELKSILENMDRIYGQPLFKALIEKLINSKEIKK